jgi:hypothetical protein
MACNDCPPIEEDLGCIEPSLTSCITYDGADKDCADIASGQTLNQVIEQLADNDCDLQEQIDDLSDSIEELSGNQYIFSCQDLNTCQLDNLGDVQITNPTTGQFIKYDGVKFVNYTPQQFQFSCQELSGCSLDNLGNVVETSVVSGDVLINNGTNWVNQSFSSLLLAQNGLTKSGSSIKLGGTLTENTSITGNFDIYLGNKNYIFGDDNSFIGSTGVKFVHKLTKSLNSLSQGFSTNFKFSDFTIDSGFSLGVGAGLFNDNNLTRLYVNNSKSISYSSKVANQTSYVQFRGVGTPTLTMSGLNGNIGVLGNHMAYAQLDNATDDAANKATITHFANYHSLITAQNTNHNEITNFYHLFLADSTNNLASPSYLGTRYGVYQEGTSDTNFFAANITNTPLVGSGNRAVYSTANGTLTNSSSDGTLKENVENLNYGLETVLNLRPITFNWKDKEKLGSQKEIGFIAQEVNAQIPELIGSNSDGTLSVDYPKLIPVLVNVIKELNERIKVLENKN